MHEYPHRCVSNTHDIANFPMSDTVVTFQYTFRLPSGGDEVSVHFVADRPDLVATVGAACFKEWRDAIENDFDIHSAEEYTQDILDKKMNTKSPFVLVAHTAEVKEGNYPPLIKGVMERQHTGISEGGPCNHT